MGTETVDQYGLPYVLVFADVSVFDPGTTVSDSLVSAGRRMEADYGDIFRIPSISARDGLPSKQFPLYGGTVTIPDGSTVIVMEYDNHTWRLLTSGSPVVSVPLANKSLPSSHISEEALSDISITASVPICNSFSSLPEDFGSRSEAYVTAFSQTSALKVDYNNVSNICANFEKKLLLFIAHMGIPTIGHYSSISNN